MYPRETSSNLSCVEFTFLPMFQKYPLIFSENDVLVTSRRFGYKRQVLEGSQHVHFVVKHMKTLRDVKLNALQNGHIGFYKFQLLTKNFTIHIFSKQMPTETRIWGLSNKQNIRYEAIYQQHAHKIQDDVCVFTVQWQKR